MRYHEIIEADRDLAGQITAQRARVADAFAALKSKEASAADKRVAAQRLPVGPERARRLQAASRREADARREYNNKRTAANDRAADEMAKA